MYTFESREFMSAIDVAFSKMTTGGRAKLGFQGTLTLTTRLGTRLVDCAVEVANAEVHFPPVADKSEERSVTTYTVCFGNGGVIAVKRVVNDVMHAKYTPQSGRPAKSVSTMSLSNLAVGVH